MERYYLASTNFYTKHALVVTAIFFCAYAYRTKKRKHWIRLYSIMTPKPLNVCISLFSYFYLWVTLKFLIIIFPLCFVDLERKKKKALQRNNLSEAARFCNLIGETLSRNGKYIYIYIYLCCVLSQSFTE